MGWLAGWIRFLWNAGIGRTAYVQCPRCLMIWRHIRGDPGPITCMCGLKVETAVHDDQV